ncbi:Asp_protease_2 domain-containing protein [Cucumis melo var. makuwa]|uniref:Asp_protease_2 domain-containing protein n=1 Tax=Cucumis melo var. makuwa TaxID=1194695 RepID=A0A5D3D8E3_CUCMM|nr:Asp_protease_2 domain-containing protein [Cucumis melo var. makuwa]
MQKVVLQRLETLARPQIMHKNVKNSFEIGDRKALVGLEYIKLGKIIKKCKKEEDQSKITKNPIQESKITTKNLKIRVLLMMYYKKGQKTVAILEEDEHLIKLRERDFGQDEEILEPDERERLSCVVQRVLIALENDISHQQRHSLFKTRCTIQSNVCNMIIDRKLVTTFKLEIEPRSNPYKIELIKKGGNTQISEICSVPLSIGGTYKDQTVCDVLDIDVCHIYLGRPWQYDVQAIYRGSENTYEFQWMNKKIVLIPLSKKSGVNPKKINSHLFIVDLDEVLDDANEVREFHATNNLPNTLAEVAENSFKQNKGFQLGNLSVESKSQGPSRTDTDAFVVGDIVANELPCSRKRRLHKPTRRYIEEFASIKEEPTNLPI